MSLSIQEKQNEIINALKQQVHRSFLQINEMEKLFNMELEHTKKELDSREQQLKQREEDIRKKYHSLETKLRIDNHFALETKEDWHSLEDISIIKSNPSFKDSSVLGLHRLLLDSEQKTKSPELKLETLKELQKNILAAIDNPPPALLSLFAMTNEFCLENCRLNEELANCVETSEIYKSKHADRLLQIKRYQAEEIKLRNSKEELNQQHQQLSSKYEALVDSHCKLQEEDALKTREIRQLRAFLNHIRNNTSNTRDSPSMTSGSKSCRKSPRRATLPCEGELLNDQLDDSQFSGASNNLLGLLERSSLAHKQREVLQLSPSPRGSIRVQSGSKTNQAVLQSLNKQNTTTISGNTIFKRKQKKV